MITNATKLKQQTKLLKRATGEDKKKHKEPNITNTN